MSQNTKITPKQRRFVAEYLVDLNGAQAAIRAGYSAKTAKVQAARLLTNANVAVALSEAQADRAKQTGITQLRVLNELALLSFSDLEHYVLDDDGQVKLATGAPEGAMRALQSIKRKVITSGSGENERVSHEVEIKLWDKPGPLKLAGQHVGLFKDKVELSGADGKPLQVHFGGRYRPEKVKK